MTLLNRTLRIATPVAFLLLPLGCGPSDRRVEVAESRPGTHPGVKLDLSSKDRFGSPFANPGQGASGAGTGDSAEEPLDYALPPGWAKAAPAQFRDINLTAPGGVECWVSVLPAAADALAHLARWQRQLGLAEPTQADVDALPRVPLLGASAYRVDRTSADGAKRMVGSMLLLPARHVFVKMQGAPAAVAAQLAALSAFEASLRIGGASSGGGVAQEPAPAGSGAGDGPIHWTTPKGWTDKGPATMKLVEFETPDGARAWLTLLSGDGGGLVNNVTRWCGQIGRDPMSTSEIDALSRWNVLGRPSIYVPLLGTGKADGLLGVIVPLDQSTLYIKMTGPSDVLQAREGEFRAMCEGLKQ